MEETEIGISVGRLRKHLDWEVQNLATRLVDVWKKQLAEHRKQAVINPTRAIVTAGTAKWCINTNNEYPRRFM